MPAQPVTKKAANLSINADLLREAKALEINLSQAFEAYLAELVDHATVAHLLDFAKIVREKARKRRIIDAATEMLRNAYDEAKADSEIIAEAEEAIGAIDATNG